MFYTAIKSTNANARVLTCIDQRWTWEDGTANQYGAKKFIDAFTVDVASHGNIDWGVCMASSSCTTDSIQVLGYACKL